MTSGAHETAPPARRRAVRPTLGRRLRCGVTRLTNPDVGEVPTYPQVEVYNDVSGAAGAALYTITMATHPAQEGSARTPVRAWPRCFPREQGYGPAVATASAIASRWQRRWGDALVVPAPGPGNGQWAGAPSATSHEGVTYLAYRIRLPIAAGRGHANVVARSADGLRFETLTSLTKDRFGAESLEATGPGRHDGGRVAALRQLPIPGTKHWRIDVVEASTPEGLGAAHPRTVLPGDPTTYGIKDAVVLWHQGKWHLWASRHPLDDPRATDRMTTEYATSDDGLDWQWRGTALAPRAGTWDQRAFVSLPSSSAKGGQRRSTTVGPRLRRTTRNAPASPRDSDSTARRVRSEPHRGVGARRSWLALPHGRDGRGRRQGLLRGRPGRRCPRAAHRRSWCRD